ncbi:MAG TPA: fibronectin type III domain-containing protein, partial [Candidatus Eisenbacteria bacterium]
MRACGIGALARSLAALSITLVALAGCSGDDGPVTGNVRVTLRNASLGIDVDTGEIDTLWITLLDMEGEPVDSTLVLPAPPLSGGTRTFDLEAPIAAGLTILVKATGERPVAGAPPATYVRGILRRGLSAPFDMTAGGMAPVDVELTSFVTQFHDVAFMNDGARHRVSWQPLAGAVRWRLSIREGALPARDTVLVDTSFTATGLPVTYQVQAIDADTAEGAPGDRLMPGLLLPGPPVNLRLIPRTGERMEVRWNRGTGFVRDWEIERRAEGGNFLPLISLDVDTLLFSDSTLVDGRRWEYRARSRNANGVSAWTTTVAAFTPLNVPDGLVLTPNDLEFGLGWTERSLSEEGFVLERATGNGTFIPLATLPVNASGYTDAPLAERTRYRYRVQAFRGEIRSAYSTVVEGTT